MSKSLCREHHFINGKCSICQTQIRDFYECMATRTMLIDSLKCKCKSHTH